MGFAGLLEHVAAAAFGSSCHSDLLVASAAKETEYMLKTAAAAAAALFGKFLFDPFSKCVSEFDLVSFGNAGNWPSGFLLLCCVFWCQRRDPGKVLPSLLGKGKQRFTSEKVKVPCEVFDLQASTQEAICETESDCY